MAIRVTQIKRYRMFQNESENIYLRTDMAIRLFEMRPGRHPNVNVICRVHAICNIAMPRKQNSIGINRSSIVLNVM
jgi:hypothetical protein